MERDDLDGAEDLHHKALALNEELGRKEGLASQYGNLGTVALKRGDRSKACEHWAKALALFEEVGATPQVEQVRKNMDIAGRE